MHYERYETIKEHYPESHVIAEGVREDSASYLVPNREEYGIEDADSNSPVKVTDIINKLTP